jgi:hypothetical protein
MYLDAYYSGDWTKAKKFCKELMKEESDLKHYYELMMERLEEGLPPNWDGTYHATSK